MLVQDCSACLFLFVLVGGGGRQSPLRVAADTIQQGRGWRTDGARIRDKPQRSSSRAVIVYGLLCLLCTKVGARTGVRKRQLGVHGPRHSIDITRADWRGSPQATQRAKPSKCLDTGVLCVEKLPVGPVPVGGPKWYRRRQAVACFCFVQRTPLPAKSSVFGWRVRRP